MKQIHFKIPGYLGPNCAFLINVWCMSFSKGVFYPPVLDIAKSHEKNEYDKDITGYGGILKAMIDATEDSSELATVSSSFI